jgi:hypothetical protein
MYRLIYHRKYRNVILAKDLSPDVIRKQIIKLTWQKDTYKELWDAVGSPRWVQFALNEIEAGRKQPKGALDCDEFSVWSSAVMIKTLFPSVLNVFYIDNKGKYRGHHVSLFDMLCKYYHIGNWGQFGPYESLAALINGIIPNGGKLVGWAQFDPITLRVIDYDVRLPIR